MADRTRQRLSIFVEGLARAGTRPKEIDRLTTLYKKRLAEQSY